jgi:hypothetical protein
MGLMLNAQNLRPNANVLGVKRLAFSILHFL